MAHSRVRRLLTPADIYAITLVSDARISPGGDVIAYIQTILDRDKNDYQSSIAMISTGGEPRRFTWAGAKDTAPRWPPSGDRLAFLSNRSGSKQIWTIPYDGGEASQLTDLSEEVTAFTWSPDGSTIAFASKAVSAEPEQQPAPDMKTRKESGVVHITKIRFRADGTPGFLDQKRTHLWCIPSTGGQPRQVTSGDYDDSQPAFSPDGSELAFVSNRTSDREFNCASEIWAVPIQGGEARCMAGGDDAYFWHPAWSPDGAVIAFTGHQQAATEHATNFGVWLAPAGGEGEPHNLTAALDRPVGDFALSDTAIETDPGVVWSPDGTMLYFQVSDAGNVHLYRVPLKGGDAERVVGGARRVLGFSLGGDGQVAFVASDPLNPGDVAVCAPDGSDERRLTAVNAGLLNNVELSAPEEFRVTSQPGGQEIQGWIMKPAGFQEGRRYPMILEIHGGPHALYANAYFHEFQLLAARGYVVVYTNPPGSQGYGESFAQYTHAAWGEKDMPAVMTAVDHVIAQGYVDPARLGVTGGSYGGYLTNWIIGHSDRFKAAITQRCVTNLASMYGTSDIGFFFGEYEFGGTPWDAPEQFARLSPITYVREMNTPLLIIHSEQDYRCPVEQAEQLFVALKRLRREVEFIRFPDESHGLSRSGKPAHRIERLERIIDWFDRHLQPPAVTPPE